MTNTPPDWVLIEAAKRSAFVGNVEDLQHNYGLIKAYAALCDMILKHEQPPVERKLLCAREAHMQWDGTQGASAWVGFRAIELYLEGFGK